MFYSQLKGVIMSQPSTDKKYIQLDQENRELKRLIAEAKRPERYLRYNETSSLNKKKIGIWKTKRELLLWKGKLMIFAKTWKINLNVLLSFKKKDASIKKECMR